MIYNSMLVCVPFNNFDVCQPGQLNVGVCPIQFNCYCKPFVLNSKLAFSFEKSSCFPRMLQITKPSLQICSWEVALGFWWSYVWWHGVSVGWAWRSQLFQECENQSTAVARRREQWCVPTNAPKKLQTPAALHWHQKRKDEVSTLQDISTLQDKSLLVQCSMSRFLMEWQQSWGAKTQVGKAITTSMQTIHCHLGAKCFCARAGSSMPRPQNSIPKSNGGSQKRTNKTSYMTMSLTALALASRNQGNALSSLDCWLLEFIANSPSIFLLAELLAKFKISLTTSMALRKICRLKEPQWQI